MLCRYSTRELVEMAIRKVNFWIDEGLPPTLAVIVVSTAWKCDQQKLLDLWLDTKVDEVQPS